MDVVALPVPAESRASSASGCCAVHPHAGYCRLTSLAVLLAVSRLYVTVPGRVFALGEILSATVFLAGIAVYLYRRPSAFVLVWRDGERTPST